MKVAIAALLSLLLCGAAAGPSQPPIRSIGLIVALGDACMFERVSDAPLEWIEPPEASFLEISDWGIDEDVTRGIMHDLGSRYGVQRIPVEHQNFDTWTYDSLSRHIRELPAPEVAVDAYLVVLRDWRADTIGNSDHQVAGLGLYRRDFSNGGQRYGVFASYRVLLMNPDTGAVIESRPALLENGRLPWLPAEPSLWPRNQNELSATQRRELHAGFLKLIRASLPRTLQQLGVRDRS